MSVLILILTPFVIMILLLITEYLAEDLFEYKIISINEVQLILTKGPFHRKICCYARDPMANMPWVCLKGKRPIEYLLCNALKTFKCNNITFYGEVDGKVLCTLERHGLPPNFTGILEYPNGSKYWFVNEKYHRLDGPAVECADGAKSWYVDGLLHRLDGPAVECINGSKIWYVDGKLHRLDGPAIEYIDGSKTWWINGKQCTQEQHKLLHSIMKLKGIY